MLATGEGGGGGGAASQEYDAAGRKNDTRKSTQPADRRVRQPDVATPVTWLSFLFTSPGRPALSPAPDQRQAVVEDRSGRHPGRSKRQCVLRAYFRTDSSPADNQPPPLRPYALDCSPTNS